MLLYLHIPYCDSKCHYCSFNSYVDKFDTRTAYMEALQTQLKYELKRFDVKRQSIESIFIGGGTPSTVHPKLYAPLFAQIAPYLSAGAEITTEANPNSASEGWLKGMKALGVNRVSFGVQSFDTDKLKALGRAHTPDQAKASIIAARNLGFEHISLDLIYNYQGDTRALLLSDITQAFSLPIDHISAYELTIEDGTKFSATPELRQENETLAFFVAEEITKRGFSHYEISNFGQYQSKHNKGYWELKDYMGVGAGAVGFLTDTRFYPQAGIENYIADPTKVSTEKLSTDELLTEKIFLGLRSTVGIDSTLLSDTMRQKANLLLAEGKLSLKENIFYNPNYFLSDELALFILG